MNKPDEPRIETGLEIETEATAYRRDRLLAALALMMGAALLLALPFALRAGAEFFLPVTAALVIAIALVPVLEWLERRRVPVEPVGLALRDPVPRRRQYRGRGDRLPGDRMGAPPARPGRPNPRDARPAVRSLCRSRAVHRRSRPPVRPRPRRRHPDGDRRDPQFAAPDHRHLGAVRGDPDVLRGAGDLLLPRRLDPDAQAHDHDPRQLRRRDDHGARDPAGGRRDLDLSRHDHHREHLRWA